MIFSHDKLFIGFEHFFSDGVYVGGICTPNGHPTPHANRSQHQLAANAQPWVPRETY